MISFISSLIDRILEPAHSVQPRIHGRFEQTPGPFYSFDAGQEQLSPDEQSPATEGRPVPKSSDPIVQTASVTIPGTSTGPSSTSYSTSLQETAMAGNQPPEKHHPAKQDAPLPQAIYPSVPSQQDATGEINEKGLQHRKEFSRITPAGKSMEQPYPPIAAYPGSPAKQPNEHQKFPAAVLPAVSSKNKPPANQAGVNPVPDNTMPIRQLPTMAEGGGSGWQRQRGRTSAGQPAQTINISIGRIEVRVSHSPAPAESKSKNDSLSVMSLDEYLTRKNPR